MNKINIQCGIKGEQTEEGQNKFWPVLQAIPLIYSWAPAKDRKYSLVFTSKIAVNLFSQWPQLNNIEHICAVGKSTAECIEKKSGPVLYPEKEGLYNLLTQISFSIGSIVSVFTAENGKTTEILQQISQQRLNFECQKIPVYRLEPLKENFLDPLFSIKTPLQNSQFIFHCRSGMVLRTVVEQLKVFFSCNEVRSLPSYIYFLVEVNKQSIKNEIQALDLIDRITS